MNHVLLLPSTESQQFVVFPAERWWSFLPGFNACKAPLNQLYPWNRRRHTTSLRHIHVTFNVKSLIGAMHLNLPIEHPHVSRPGWYKQTPFLFTEITLCPASCKNWLCVLSSGETSLWDEESSSAQTQLYLPPASKFCFTSTWDYNRTDS